MRQLRRSGSTGRRLYAVCDAMLWADRPKPARRVVTTPFCDQVRSTSFAELVDAEAARELQLRYFAFCSHAILPHGGTVAKHSATP